MKDGNPGGHTTKILVLYVVPGVYDQIIYTPIALNNTNPHYPFYR